MNDKKTNVRYWMLGLVFINVVINYLDRTNLSIAAPELSKELGISNIQRGYIFSAFGWTYAALQIPGGLIADRFIPRVLYAFCLITWSLATICQGLVNGFTSLFGFRLITGAFEAPSYPINNRIVTSWFPDQERASAIALYVSGQFIGLAFLTPILATIQISFGWRGLFWCTGIIGLIWGVVWYVFYRDPLQHKKVNQAELDYIEKGGGVFQTKKGGTTVGPPVWKWSNLKRVLSSRTLWGVYIAQFAVNAMLYFFLTWFPTYLVEFRGLDFVKSGYLASIPFLGACAGILISGFLSDNLVRRGVSVEVARKAPIIIGLLISTCIIGANYTDETAWVIFFLALAFFGAGMALISWVFVSILAPKDLIGLTGGVFNFMGNMASIAVPIVIGYLASEGDFRPVLIFIGGLGMIGALSYIFVVGKIVRVQ